MMDVTLDDLKQYISANGYPEGWLRFEFGTFDGLYLIQSGEGWNIILQERGQEIFKSSFPTKDKAMDYILTNFYLSSVKN